MVLHGRMELSKEPTLQFWTDPLIRNQQVVGLNPTGGSKETQLEKDFSALRDWLEDHIRSIVRFLCDLVGARLARSGLRRWSRDLRVAGRDIIASALNLAWVFNAEESNLSCSKRVSQKHASPPTIFVGSRPRRRRSQRFLHARGVEEESKE